MPSSHIPQIRISLSSEEALDPGLKKEISQQVREFRAQKLSQRGRSPGHIQNQSQAAGQGHRAAKSQAEAVSQSNRAANPSQQRDKPRDRLVSAASPAAQLKAVQPRPQSPRQGPSPRPGSEPASAPVSTRPRCRSVSPCRRLDVDVDEPWVGWQRGLHSAASHQNIAAAAHSDVFGLVDPLSRSFPDQALQSALSRCSHPGSLLEVPDGRCFPSPALGSRRGYAEAGGSASACDLSTSAPAAGLWRSLAEVGPPRSLSYHCLDETCWGRPQSPGPQSPGPQRPLWSTASCGSLATADASSWRPDKLRPLFHLFLSPKHAACRPHVSPAARRSPTHSPFGSQNLICAASPGGNF